MPVSFEIRANSRPRIRNRRLYGLLCCIVSQHAGLTSAAAHLPDGTGSIDSRASFDQQPEASSRELHALYRQGLLHEGQGDDAAAIAEETEVIRRDPTMTEAYTVRAVAYQMQGQDDKALDDALQAIKLGTTREIAYELAGKIHSKQGHFDLAIAEYDVSF